MERLECNQSYPIGVGLRHTHFPELEDRLSKGEKIGINFFEALSENFLSTRGRPFSMLMKVREHYPVALHGVSMSIASDEEIDFDYLKKLKELYRLVDPIITSDHMCFTGMAHSNLHNLLPFAYNEENLKRISERVRVVQDFLERQMIFENLSAYFSLKSSTMSEAQFLTSLCDNTGAGLLLDVNNIYVNSFNQKFEPETYLEQTNFSHVKQMHLAGYSDMTTHLFDTHSREVQPPVWELFSKAIAKAKVPVLVEWDEEIPELSKVVEQAQLSYKFEGR